MPRYLFITACLILSWIFATGRSHTAGPDQLTVVSAAPTPRTVTAPVESAIVVDFDRPLDPATVHNASFHAFGRWSGPVSGTISLSNSNQTATLTPARSFSAGEAVMVVLANTITGDDAVPLRPGGYSFQFWTAAAPATAQMAYLDTLNVRTEQAINTRAYGGVATDMNGDGWLDLSIVNEDTADVRVFLNQADGSGGFHPFLEPPTPVQQRASPSEPADFNGDGQVDLAVVNINTGTVSVLLGNGDGTFQPQQLITVGSTPRGIALLDGDGDGDIDIVNTNSGAGGNLAITWNNGDGSFGTPDLFEGGDTMEWSLAAADMNEDGLLDLVVGSRDSVTPMILIHLNNGDGSFTLSDAEAAGGPSWMINVADVNGDGHDDVATANSSSNNGAILLGDGSGQLGPATTYATDPFPLATDLGDIDGDGDLDWVTSSFSGNWFLFANDGNGAFAFTHEFDAPQAASCALMLDFDNDGDLDLALIDELADVVILQRNGLYETFLPNVPRDFIPR